MFQKTMSSFKPCLIMLALLLVDSEAEYVGDAVRENVKILCPFTCRKVCPIIDTAIEFRCHIGCRSPRKRFIPDFMTSGVQYRVQPMSNDFIPYDLNGDQLISLKEFSTAENLPLLEVYDVFTCADTNKDYTLDMIEFKKAPFVRWK
ncbi:hypothetical protein CHS0354_030767 [Potamilus streckersoni]|uniref:EF-hand domain-containing protein n=1 Tax=Potamilus streckersoni TaxID=2493646 RepID=A0AAE0TDC5_9BIVA|nr:hypothetical protein CHS0354_030767 [Potamilus streckersoni]